MAVAHNRVMVWVKEAVTLGRLCYRESVHDQATTVAAALTYRTIFSLIPLLVFSVLVFAAFPASKSVGRDMLTKVYDYMGLSTISMPAPEPSGRRVRSDDGLRHSDYARASGLATASGSSTHGETGGVTSPPSHDDSFRPDTSAAPAPIEPSSATEGTPATTDSIASTLPGVHASTGPRIVPMPPEMKAELDAQRQVNIARIMDRLAEKASNINFRGIAGVGIIVLFYGALSLIVGVEQAFNRIYGSTVERPWVDRVVYYFALLTLGTLLLAVSIGLVDVVTGILVAQMPVVGPIVAFLSHFSALMASWILLFILYMKMPTARVKVRAAAIGSFIAAVGWELAKWGFKLYVTKALPYAAIYGTLGLVPLFLFWVYTSWLIVIMGLEISFVIHARPLGRLKHLVATEVDEFRDARWVIPMMAAIAKGFAAGKVTRVDDLAGELGISSRAAARLAQLLEKAGLVHTVPEGKKGLTSLSLAMPAEQVPMTRLVELANQSQALTVHASPRAATAAGWRAIEALNHAQMTAAKGKTLADLVHEPAAVGTA